MVSYKICSQIERGYGAVVKLNREERNAYFKHLDNMHSTSMVESAWENGKWEGLKKRKRRR